MDDIIEINDSDSNECSITGYHQGKKRKAEEDAYYSDSSGSSTNITSDSDSIDEEPILVESSESEPEFECETDWDTDCQVVDVRPTGKQIHGFFCPSAPAIPEHQDETFKAPKLRSEIADTSFIFDFKEKWESGKETAINDIVIISDPFKTCVVQNFLQDAEFLSKIIDEFNEVEWNERSLDLYEFYQSKDLQHINLPHLKLLYEFLKEDVMKWVSELTGSELTHISATCSLYSDTDYLLVHDDLREDRVVAYILYLTRKEGWDNKFGGALQLFSKDEEGQPIETVKEIWPHNNQFVFFPVSNETHHQVAEVTSKDDSRMTINGWFHCKNLTHHKTLPLKVAEKGLYSNISIPPQNVDIDLATWISSVYLETDAMAEIQRQIVENSEISLRKFFQDEPLKELLSDLRDEELKWEKCGPLNWRNYEVLEEGGLPHVLERFFKLFKSKNMFDLLEKYTGLELGKATSSVRYELQRWKPGFYSLLSDYDWHSKKELDVIMYLGCSRSLPVVGGQTLYVATDEEVGEPFIVLEPEENNLNLIFRDTARITKFVSTQSNCKCFYLLVCSYSE